MGLANLISLDSMIAANELNYRAYQKGLAGITGLRLYAHDEREQNNYQYVVVEVLDDCPISRDQLVAVLHAENVLARKYFWPGCHGMKPYRELYPHARLVLPNTERVAARVIVLPTGTTLSVVDIASITDLIRVACGHRHPVASEAE
jgi:dTDP-4-amino-4,6-dideoxygalactose transaminase